MIFGGPFQPEHVCDLYHYVGVYSVCYHLIMPKQEAVPSLELEALFFSIVPTVFWGGTHNSYIHYEYLIHLLYKSLI